MNSYDWSRRVTDAKRDLATRSLIGFIQYTFRTYKADPFHELVASYLDEAVAGNIHKIAIAAPPQSGKSELFSRRFPAYWLANRPDDPIILSSYNATLAQTMSRHARAIMESTEFGELFPTIHTNPSSRAVDLWEMEDPHRGQVRAAGVGGGITGHPAACGLIDDPFPDWETAQSELQRDKIWEWYQGTFLTRLWEDYFIGLIMTRWHPDDLIGRVIKKEGVVENGGEWVYLRFPALAETQEERDFHNKQMGIPIGQPDPLGREPGEPLVPSRYSKEEMEKRKKAVGSFVWSAEYQGTPTLAEGNMFKRDWFPTVNAAPERIARRGRYWDFAANTESGQPRTAGVLMSIDRDGTIYIEDVVYGNWSPDRRNREVKRKAREDKDRYRNYGRLWFEQEPGSAGKEVADQMVRLLSGYSARPDRPTGDKDVRLEPFRAQAEAGNVRIVKGSWNDDYIDEMCAVPNGLVRDMADATAGAFNKLAGRHVSAMRVGS